MEAEECLDQVLEERLARIVGENRSEWGRDEFGPCLELDGEKTQQDVGCSNCGRAGHDNEHCTLPSKNECKKTTGATGFAGKTWNGSALRVAVTKTRP